MLPGRRRRVNLGTAAVKSTITASRLSAARRSARRRPGSHLPRRSTPPPDGALHRIRRRWRPESRAEDCGRKRSQRVRELSPRSADNVELVALQNPSLVTPQPSRIVDEPVEGIPIKHRSPSTEWGNTRTRAASPTTSRSECAWRQRTDADIRRVFVRQRVEERSSTSAVVRGHRPHRSSGRRAPDHAKPRRGRGGAHYAGLDSPHPVTLQAKALRMEPL